MSPALRVLDEEDARRAAAVKAFLERFDQSPETKRTMHSALRSIVGLFPGQRLDLNTFPWEWASDPIFYEVVQQRIGEAHYASATASKLLSALRGLLRTMSRRGLVDPELLRTTLETSSRMMAVERMPPRALHSDELRLMLSGCRRDPNPVIGARDAAVLAVMASTGARRSELAGLERQHLDLKKRVVGFRAKGARWRTAALHPAAAEYLRLWLSHGVTGASVFCPVQKNRLVLADRSISEKTVWKIVVKRRDQAELDPKITPHSFRRWFVTSLLDNGVDLLTVTRAVGHRNPSTTMRYDRRDGEAMREVVGGLELPSWDEME